MQESTTQSEQTKLYRLTSVVNNWPHRDKRYDNVHITWLVDRFPSEAKPPVPYEQAIKDFDSNAKDVVYTMGIICELFTEAEATAFQSHLKYAHGDTAERQEVVLPIVHGGCFPMSAVPVGGNTDRYTVWKEHDYPLGFKVDGFYCIECPHVAGPRFAPTRYLQKDGTND